MKTAILLPETSPNSDFDVIKCLTANKNDTIESAIAALNSIATPATILGSTSTPVIWWLAAHQQFPKAACVLMQGDEWHRVGSIEGKHSPAGSEAPASQQNPKPQTHAQANKPKQADTKPAANTPTGNNTHEWINEVYKVHAWSKSDAERLLVQYLEQAEALSSAQPKLADELRKAARQGKRAAELTKELEQRLKNGESDESIKLWIQSLEGKEPKRALSYLPQKLKKDREHNNNKRQQRKENAEFRITLPYTKLVNNRHPQSLLAVKPSQQWTILIDETGTVFTGDAENMNESNKDLGRIIALAMPQNHKLPDLNNKTHAVDLNHHKVQELLSQIVNSPCGILGASLKRDLKSHNWMAAITQLTRWALLMLPISGTTRVKVQIENRGQFDNSTTLLALEANLYNELLELAPERFRDLHLTLEIMGKNHPHNGYVDVIANCWGSPDDIKRKMLARTAWRGHCLLQTDDLSRTEYLYRSISNPAGVDAQDWFQLCHEAANEPEHSLLNDILNQLGQRSSTNPTLWQQYLREVQQRMASKQYSATSLNRALTWLQDNRPEHCELPGILNLQYQSAQLAAANHLGRTDLSLARHVIQLANALHEEAAPDAAEAILRIAISATNSFDFESAMPIIQEWLKLPIATVGLLNHGKLQSTTGQLHAFSGNNSAAIQWFENAITTFGRLSDPQRRLREQQQTLIYQAIAQMDSGHPDVGKSIGQLLNRATGKQGEQAIRQIARSGDALRFEHYLLLRWLITGTAQQAHIDTYLSAEEDWQSEETHPWMLINAYRAWLLVRAGKTHDAKDYLQEAIDACQQHHNSAVLNGMAHTLSALAQSLGLPPGKHLSEPLPQGFRIDQLAQLSRAVTDQERLTAINTLLPFNFH
jgi:hypothetical protein